MPASHLVEILLSEVGEKASVQINVQKIVKVFGILGREGIHRPIGSRHRVHEGRHGPVEHLEEGIADGVLA